MTEQSNTTPAEKKVKLSKAQFEALRTIEGCNPDSYHHGYEVDPIRVSTLNALGNRGLIYKVPYPVYGLYIRLTEQGRAALEGQE